MSGKEHTLKQKETPVTPFATCLSGSAKGTSLCLTNIFRRKKRRPPVLCLVLSLLLALGCGSPDTEANAELIASMETVIRENPEYQLPTYGWTLADLR